MVLLWLERGDAVIRGTSAGRKGHIRGAGPKGPVIPAKAGIHLNDLLKRVPPTRITVLDHLEFLGSLPSGFRLSPERRRMM